jgi:hypothetical protein
MFERKELYYEKEIIGMAFNRDDGSVFIAR